MDLEKSDLEEHTYDETLKYILLPFPTLEKHGFRHNTFLPGSWSVLQLPDARNVRWYDTMWWMWRMVPQPLLKIVKIGSVRKLERIFNLYLYTVIFISLLILFKKLRRQISWDFWQGVPNILAFLEGGAYYPTIWWGPVFLKGCYIS